MFLFSFSAIITKGSDQAVEKLIMIKYGELSTKKGNIGFFLKTLKDNVKASIDNLNVVIKHDKNRMFITLKEDNYDRVIKKLQTIFGIHEIVIGYKMKNDFPEICQSLENLIQDKTFSSFKIETKRSDKNYPLTSPEISKKLGGIVLKTIDTSVDVHNPKVTINIEIRNDAAYIYFEKISGLGGFPVGTLGKGLLMLSGGIDSPVAGYLALKRGVKLECIYFDSPPHTSEMAKNKVLKLAKKLSIYNGITKIHVIRFTDIQESIYKSIPHEYLITIMRRMMYRISAIISKSINAKILVNGESIGQVASQTLTSMNAINEVVKIPVIRPLACFDKLDIIKIAREINTYDISIEPFEDCCTVFVPDHPVINPDPKKCSEYEKLIDWENLVYQAIKEHEIIKITAKDNKHSSIL